MPAPTPSAEAHARRWIDVIQGQASLGIDSHPVLHESVCRELAIGPIVALRLPPSICDTGAIRALCARFSASAAAADALSDWVHSVRNRLQHLRSDAPRSLRLERLDGPGCPRFHVDRVALRVLCTLFGPGTQWLPEPVQDREELLRPGSEQSVSDRVVETLPTGVAALLRGDVHPTAAGRGLIHRSPPVPSGQVRVLVAMDVF